MGHMEKDIIGQGKDEKGAIGQSVAIIAKEIIPLISGSVLLAIAMFLPLSANVKLAFYTAAYIIVGGKILMAAGKNMLLRGEFLDENFLMSISTSGAMVIGEYPEAVAVMLFFRVGEFLQDRAVDRSRRSIADLMDIRPEYANVKDKDGISRVPPEDVRVGDMVVVRPGERVPIDGIVVEGLSAVDTSALTGESMPRNIEPGREVLAGFINKSGLFTLEASREYRESAVTKILKLIEDAGSRKAPTEKFITRFSRYYTPAVVLAAAALAFTPPIVIPGEMLSKWVYRALVFLVVSCPCALVVSIPLGFFGGIGGASRSGILIKGGNFLEALANMDTVVFDKTGTLTKGVFKVTDMAPAEGISNEELLEYAAMAEHGSNHPVALSVLEAYGKDVNSEGTESYEEIPGYGIKAVIHGSKVLAGNVRLLEEENIEFRPMTAAKTVVYVAVDNEFLGSITVADVIKEDAPHTVKGLKKLGTKRVVMLTGDNRKVAEDVAEVLEIDKVYWELLPHQKVSKVEGFQRDRASRGKVAFVGDGINDAPALARADIGIAMGALGSDAAIEAADVVIMTDEPSKIVKAVEIARRTKRIIWQNIVFALGVKAVVLMLGAIGLASMWEAVFADVGVTVIAVLNSMRAMKIDRE